VSHTLVVGSTVIPYEVRESAKARAMKIVATPAGVEVVVDHLPCPPTHFPGRQAHGINHGVQQFVGLAERHVGIGREDPVRQSAERTQRQRTRRVGESEGDRVEGKEPFVAVEGFGQRRSVERRAERTLHVVQKHCVGVPIEDHSTDGA
jgi:hypothetical protein